MYGVRRARGYATAGADGKFSLQFNASSGGPYTLKLSSGGHSITAANAMIGVRPRSLPDPQASPPPTCPAMSAEPALLAVALVDFI